MATMNAEIRTVLKWICKDMAQTENIFSTSPAVRFDDFRQKFLGLAVCGMERFNPQLLQGNVAWSSERRDCREERERDFAGTNSQRQNDLRRLRPIYFPEQRGTALRYALVNDLLEVPPHRFERLTFSQYATDQHCRELLPVLYHRAQTI